MVTITQQKLLTKLCTVSPSLSRTPVTNLYTHIPKDSDPPPQPADHYAYFRLLGITLYLTKSCQISWPPCLLPAPRVATQRIGTSAIYTTSSVCSLSLLRSRCFLPTSLGQQGTHRLHDLLLRQHRHFLQPQCKANRRRNIFHPSRSPGYIHTNSISSSRAASGHHHGGQQCCRHRGQQREKMQAFPNGPQLRQRADLSWSDRGPKDIRQAQLDTKPLRSFAFIPTHPAPLTPLPPKR